MITLYAFCINRLRILLIIVLSSSNLWSVAQSSYVFSLDSGAYANLSGSTSLNNNQPWDDPEYHIPIGFNFEYFGQLFDSIYISDYVWFYPNGDYRIHALFADFMDRDTGSSVSDISYLLDGNPGNKILKIEWKNAGFFFEWDNLGTLNDFVNVQLWLYEVNGDIEVHIGPNSVLSPNNSSYNGNEGASIGLLTYSGENQTLSGPADNPMLYNGVVVVDGTPANGTIFRFSKCIAPVAGFGYPDSSGYTVNFTDSSTNAISYLWDFGDSSTSADQNPIHTYNDSGNYMVTLIATGNCEADTFAQLITILFTGLSDLQPKPFLMVYPNPAHDELNIYIDEKDLKSIKARILDLNGRNIKELEITNTLMNPFFSFNIEGLNRGLYILELQSNGFTRVAKIIVE